MVFYAIVVVIAIAVIIVAVWYWRFRKSFKHTIVLRDKTKGSTDLVVIDNYRYLGAAGETECIQLLSSKEFKPVPPELAKDFKRNGTEYVEAWVSETGELKYINGEIDEITKPEFNVVVQALEGNFLYKFLFWLKTFRNPTPPKIMPNFLRYLEQTDKPKGQIKFTGLDTKSKEFYANQHIKAMRFKKKDFMTWVSENAGLIVVVFLFLIVIVFWKEVTEPMAQVSANLAKVSDGQASIMSDVRLLIQERQKIEAERGGLLNGTAPG